MLVCCSLDMFKDDAKTIKAHYVNVMGLLRILYKIISGKCSYLIGEKIPGFDFTCAQIVPKNHLPEVLRRCLQVPF